VCGQHHAPAVLPPGKSQYPLYKRLGRPQGRSGRVRKISPHWDFFLCPILLVSCTLLVWNCSGIRRKTERLRAFFLFVLFALFVRFVFFVFNCPFASYRTACCGFFHYEKSDGFGRERTRDLGFQRPALKPLDHRSR
jgi:hypothetical protein